jgi:hypothetical protein
LVVADFRGADEHRAGRDSQGLLAHGLRADNEKFGLRGERPLDNNLEERVERMGLVLGAIAFHMLDQGVEGIWPQDAHT